MLRYRHHLGGRQRVVGGVDGPLVVVEVEDGLHRHQVHVRLEVGVERAHVPPVGPVPLGGARHLVLGEVVDVGRALTHHAGDEVASHIVPGAVVLGVGPQGLQQGPGGEHVVPH